MFAFVYSLQNFVCFEMDMDEESFDSLVEAVMDEESFDSLVEAVMNEEEGMDAEGEGATDIITISDDDDDDDDDDDYDNSTPETPIVIPSDEELHFSLLEWVWNYYY